MPQFTLKRLLVSVTLIATSCGAFMLTKPLTRTIRRVEMVGLLLAIVVAVSFTMSLAVLLQLKSPTLNAVLGAITALFVWYFMNEWCRF